LTALLHCSWKVRVEYGGLVGKAGSLGAVGFGVGINDQSSAFLQRKKPCTYASSKPKMCLHTCLHTGLDGEKTRRKMLFTNGTNYS
jgi:hypothetical protein